MVLDVYGTQTSNKLNTIAIPLAATPLCMVANIVLVLSFGGIIFPQILFTSLSVLIKLYYIRHTIISFSLVEGGTHANSFALPPPHNRTRFEVGAARKSHKIVPCAVFSFTTSVLTPHLSPKLSAVLIKYFTSHAILRFSSHFYHNYQLKGKYPPRIWSKTDVVDVQCFPIQCFR